MRSCLSLAVALFAIVSCGDDSSPADGGDSSLIRGRHASSAGTSHPDVLRLVVWNIKSGRDSSIEAIASRLGEFEADVIALQEVDSGTRRGDGIDQPSFLAEKLELDYAFAPTIPWDGGIYGIATLSRHPFIQARRLALTNEFAGEARTALDTSLCVERSCLRIVNHHADVELPAAVLSTQQVLEHIEPDLGSGIALVGDLNQHPSDDGPAALVAAGLVDLGDEFGDEATDREGRVDYLFVDSGLEGCVRSLTTQSEVESDHASLVADLELACIRARRGASAAREAPTVQLGLPQNQEQ